MIVVSVGTNEARFDRMLDWVSQAGLDEELVVQHGPSAVRPAGATCVAYVPYEELVELVSRSRAFVTHAGVGSILVSLGAGRRPVVVPRLERFGEAVDDHQLPLARRLAAEHLVTLVETPEQLSQALGRRDHALTAQLGASALAQDLRGYLLDRVRPVP
jgi:UDP-N-acetylglucosamine transferase subunit ALG13